ncbi:MAG: site-specific integrase [Clostridiales bacterium]|jgi:integrase/recombinase XerD|nr:site-specific integrase [Clostridiales bacterium]
MKQTAVLPKDEDIKQLMDSIDRSRFKGARDFAMIYVFYTIGMMVDELINMKISDVHPELLSVTVGYEKRLVPLKKATYDVLKQYIGTLRSLKDVKLLPDDEQTLFGRIQDGQYVPVTRQAIHDNLSTRGRKERIKCKITPMTLRNYAITNYILEGVDQDEIRRMVGFYGSHTMGKYYKMVGRKRPKRKRRYSRHIKTENKNKIVIAKDA